MTDNNPQTNICYFILTPKLVSQIYEEVKKAFLKKDGTPFKREKRFWIKNLTKIVAKNLSLNKEVVEISINNLIDNCYLIIDYKDEVYYRSIYLEKIRKLNKLFKKGREMAGNDDLTKRILGKIQTRSIYMPDLRSQETIEHLIKDSEELIEMARKMSESEERINEVKKKMYNKKIPEMIF